MKAGRPGDHVRYIILTFLAPQACNGDLMQQTTWVSREPVTGQEEVASRF